MLFKEIQDKEVVDSEGKVIGFVDDLVIDGKKITHLVVKPRMLMRAIKPEFNIEYNDILSLGNVIVLKKPGEEL